MAARDLARSVAGVMSLVMFAACAATPPSAQDKAKAFGPIIAGAHWHHVHLAVPDREAAIAYYVKHHKAVRASFEGQPAIWVQRSWILFDETPGKAKAPPSAGTTISHIGFGAVDAQAEAARQKSLGADVMTELSDISTGLGGKPGTFFFMYVRGSGGEQIEINTDPDNNFGHLHLTSNDAVASAAWYRSMFGLTPSPPYYDELVIQPGNSATQRTFFDNVLVITNQARQPATLKSTRGTVTDHIGVSVPDLNKALATATARGVKVLAPASDGPCKSCRHAFIEGPDLMAIELIEDRSPQPPVTD